MKVLALYNNENGNILFTQNETTITSASATVVDVPEGKLLVRFENGVPIFEDRPLSIEERIELLEVQNMDQDDALVELSDAIFNLE